MSDCKFSVILVQLRGGPFPSSNRQRLRRGLLGPPAIPWPKGVLRNRYGIYSGFGARDSYPLNFTFSSLPPKPHILDPQLCGVLASRATSLQLRLFPAPAFSRESAQGQGLKEKQGCGRLIRERAVQKFSGYGTRQP